MRPLRRTRSSSRGEGMRELLTKDLGRHISIMTPSMFHQELPPATFASWVPAACVVLASLPVIWCRVFQLRFSHFAAWIQVVCAVLVTWRVSTPVLLEALDAWRSLRAFCSGRVQTVLKLESLRAALQEWRSDFKHGGGSISAFGLCL